MMKSKRFQHGQINYQGKSKAIFDNNLNPAKVNVINATKDNFTEPLSAKEILDELEISKNDYYRALLMSKDEDLELNLKREPNSFFC